MIIEIMVLIVTSISLLLYYTSFNPFWLVISAIQRGI